MEPEWPVLHSCKYFMKNCFLKNKTLFSLLSNCVCYHSQTLRSIHLRKNLRKKVGLKATWFHTITFELTMENGFMPSIERNNPGPRPKVCTGDPDSKPFFSIPTLVVDPVTRIGIRSGMQDPGSGWFWVQYQAPDSISKLKIQDFIQWVCHESKRKSQHLKSHCKFGIQVANNHVSLCPWSF